MTRTRARSIERRGGGRHTDTAGMRAGGQEGGGESRQNVLGRGGGEVTQCTTEQRVSQGARSGTALNLFEP